jgi:hypothetical protein
MAFRWRIRPQVAAASATVYRETWSSREEESERESPTKPDGSARWDWEGEKEVCGGFLFRRQWLVLAAYGNSSKVISFVGDKSGNGMGERGGVL